MKTKLKYTALILLIGMTSACNTISGIGQDVESVGDAIERTAEDTKKN